MNRKFKNREKATSYLASNMHNFYISGAAYELENGTLRNDFPLGVSNTALTESVTLSVRKGILLAVLSDAEG